MIPYFEFSSIPIGPINIQVWGLFVALGFLFGALVAAKMVRRRGDDPKIIWDLLGWMILAGLIGGRLGHVLLYDLGYYLDQPLEIFAIWHGGLSVFGGFIACVLIGWWYLRKKQVDGWRYADSAIFGLPFGLAIGRIGCFLIHDHPGTVTDFFLGVEYPDGLIHHDHGLYLAINGLALAIIFLWITRKRRSVGTYIAVFSIWYGAVRFGLDFYRLNDVRYALLTPAQYLSVALVIFGVVLVVKLRNQPSKNTFLWKTKKVSSKAVQK